MTSLGTLVKPWIVFLSSLMAVTTVAADRPTEVVVLGALHQMHEEVPGYSYANLKTSIDRLHPDVLAVELTPSDLAGRVVQKNKREYQNAVYPLLQQYKWKAVAMEPEGERRAVLLGEMRLADESVQKDSPQKLEAFGTYVDTLFEFLKPKWQSVADVNSHWTDDLFAVKHAYQHKIYGPSEEKGWEGWNSFFLERITAAAVANPGKRIVVIVGVEHCYWLRGHLRNSPGIKLLDTASLLQRQH